MQNKAAIVIATTLLLSACSNHGQLDVVDKSAPQQGPVSQSTPAINPSQGAPDSTSNQASTTNSPVTEQPNAEIDLLDRLRQGFQFPAIESDLTADYAKWNVEHPTYLNDLLDRAEPFLYYLITEIEKRKLPMELALIPVIESAYKPTALSSSNASGLWQFVPSTGRGFGLRQDWWYDGRRDFIESTHAALDYLTQLNNQFDGDWFLALAAYNAGPGTVLKAIDANQRRGRQTHYQALNLRDETRNYIPKLQAIKNIIDSPASYNVTLPVKINQPYFEIVDLPGQLDLHEFSRLSEIDLEEIKHLNAGFLRWATAPEGPHRLLLPISELPRSKIALEKMAVQPTIQYHRHQIAQGDTLSTVGRRYGVSVASLQNLNKLAGTSIRAGNTLFIPLASQGTPASYSVINGNDDESKLIHRVAAGDTLWSISKRYKVAVNQLLNWNQLASDHILQLNQSLLIFAN